MGGLVGEQAQQLAARGIPQHGLGKAKPVHLAAGGSQTRVRVAGGVHEALAAQPHLLWYARQANSAEPAPSA